jgi:RNA-binding protein YlmH
VNKRSDELEIHETLEKQRGIFCQISLFYFTSIMIGLGIITSQQTALGDWTVAVDIIFMIVATVTFMFITYKMAKPVGEIVELMETTLKEIIEQAQPEDEE